MNLKTEIVKYSTKALKTVKKDSPIILTVVGAVGVIGTAVLAVKGTPLALERISEAKKAKVQKNRAMSEEEYQAKLDAVKLTPMEMAKATWKCYIPAAIAGGVTIAAVIGSHQIINGRLETVAAAYTLSEKAKEAYKEQVLQEVGPKKEEKIRTDVAKKKAREDFEYETVVCTGDTEYMKQLAREHRLCQEQYLTGKFFGATADQLKTAERAMKDRIENGKEKSASFNDFMKLLGQEGPVIGDTLGWSQGNPFELYLEPIFLNEDDPELTVTTVTFRYDPKPNFDGYCYDDDDAAPWNVN